MPASQRRNASARTGFRGMRNEPQTPFSSLKTPGVRSITSILTFLAEGVCELSSPSRRIKRWVSRVLARGISY